MINYIFITYDALKEFASDRFFQSAEYTESRTLCALLRADEDVQWRHSKIATKKIRNGRFLFTYGIDYKRGLLFDLDQFKGFGDNNSHNIAIFQKTVKYAVRYFENLPKVNCERELPSGSTTLVYPFPFTATREVDKVYIDRNSNKQDRKGKNFLTVYFFGTDEKVRPSFTNLNRAINDLRTLRPDDVTLVVPERDKDFGVAVTDLNKIDLPIDASIGYHNWNYYLTDAQRAFVKTPISRAERLEGAAGTGKTLTMVLRCIEILENKRKTQSEYHIIFITHSLATKERITDIFNNNWAEFKNCVETAESKPMQSVCVTTLQEWSANHLGTSGLNDGEYLDKDASGSKELQILYIEQAFEEERHKRWDSYKILCSEEFKSFIENTPYDELLELMRQEVAVLIKGRAGGNADRYRSLERPKYCIPLINDSDKSFMLLIYQSYQNSLIKVGQYDSDDIVLTALGHVNTPIWNRRRLREGYDACFIDETHLFNVNELSVFHCINKPDDCNKIVFAIDKSQSVGDWGMTSNSINDTFNLDPDTDGAICDHRFNTVFRSSADIVNLAFHILSSGASLFTNFENPLNYSSFNFTKDEERKCQPPVYALYKDDNDMIAESFKWADNYCRTCGVAKSSVLFVAASNEISTQIRKYADRYNKPFVMLQSRSDVSTIKKATLGSKYVIGDIDNIGGLEFEGVIIVGVDKGRVPPDKDIMNDGAYHCLSYAWHNRIYVAVSRAKYAIYITGEAPRGVSPILENALANKAITLQE